MLGGLLGVAAMAVQNALVQIALQGAPSTAVMTTNVTRFTMDVGEVLLGRDPSAVARARSRAQHTWPAIVGFTAGAALGAACFAAAGRWSLALPAGLALGALALGLAPRRAEAGQRTRIEQQRRDAHTTQTNAGDDAVHDQAGADVGKKSVVISDRHPYRTGKASQERRQWRRRKGGVRVDARVDAAATRWC